MDADRRSTTSPLLRPDSPAAALASPAPKPGQPRAQPAVGRKFDLTDAVVPPLVLSYLGVVYWVANTIVLPELSNALKVPYALATHSLLPLLTYLYLCIYLGPSHPPSAAPRAPPQAIASRTTAYVCADARGSVHRCWKDGCRGAHKPARVRHCSICRTCRVGFDHHCPWFGTCITSSSYLPFLLFLLLVPPTVACLAAPVVHPVLTHLGRVWSFARARDSVVWRAWFGWGWSWVLGIGPIGRAGVGLVLGYWRWEGEVGSLDRGWLASLLFVGVLVGIIAIGLAGATLRSILISVTPIEGRILAAYHRTDPRLRSTHLLASPRPPRRGSSGGERTPGLVDPRVWVWVPSGGADGSGLALRTRVEEKPFDLGWKANLRLVVEDGWAAWSFLPWNAPDPQPRPLQLNPAVWQRLAYEASLQLALGDDSETTGEDGSESEGSAS